MSRCFPYPPPGYVMSNGLGGEAVRDPIKLKRPREDTITELDNKKRRDKKERKEKKEKKKNDKRNKELGYTVDTYILPAKSILPKAKEEEAERSDLTEEHEQPVCFRSFCHSPDSSGRGNKINEDDTGSITKTHGNILRIRLPLQRHREPEASLGADGLCSNSIIAETVAITTVPCREESHSVASCSQVLPEAAKVKDNCSADLKVNQIAGNETITDFSSSRSRKQHKVDLQYKSLIEDWIPPTLELYQDIFDDSWFLESQEQDPGCKRLKLSQGDQPCNQSSSSSLWPCARYLPEADIFALPYTLPF
ncbi:hypothetical protein M5689_016339 [Euphorbia peplus]|nr:hypothetical protein M5689_016339 [Euphorbia peplus]